ncbi:MAG TPA: hypothetical protein VGI05_26650 [Streptosporangiaceae bacterium]|jgi:hypothetical protein
MAEDPPRRQRRPSGPQGDAETTDPGAGSTTPEPAPASPGEAAGGSGAAPWGDPPPAPAADDGQPWHGAAGTLSDGLSRAMHQLREAERLIVNHQVTTPSPDLHRARAALSRAMEYVENEGQPAPKGKGKDGDAG